MDYQQSCFFHRSGFISCHGITPVYATVTDTALILNMLSLENGRSLHDSTVPFIKERQSKGSDGFAGTLNREVEARVQSRRTPR